MKLSEVEQRMIARLRKQQRQWRWGRWLVLLGGILLLLVAVIRLCILASEIRSANMIKTADVADLALSVAVLFPGFLVDFTIAVALFIMVIRDWHGNSTRTLLLRLVDNAVQNKRGLES